MLINKASLLQKKRYLTTMLSNTNKVLSIARVASTRAKTQKNKANTTFKAANYSDGHENEWKKASESITIRRAMKQTMRRSIDCASDRDHRRIFVNSNSRRNGNNNNKVVMMMSSSANARANENGLTTTSSDDDDDDDDGTSMIGFEELAVRSVLALVFFSRATSSVLIRRAFKSISGVVVLCAI
jgi:hypothetical protein